MYLIDYLNIFLVDDSKCVKTNSAEFSSAEVDTAKNCVKFRSAEAEINNLEFVVQHFIQLKIYSTKEF